LKDEELVVTEANAMGTLAIAYMMSLGCDTIRHGETGITIIENTPAAKTQQGSVTAAQIFTVCRRS
jgi:hypothetical protein